MDATELRALQAPLKQNYRDDPESAAIPAAAEARLGDDITCAVKSWAGDTVAGLHPAAGGDGSKACSADMLLEALVACAGVTLNSVATAMGVTVRDAVVRAEGTWDARGTLGLSKETPIGLTAIELTFELDTDADEATRARLIELTERYCVIYQTLRNPPQMSYRVAP
ncbi:MAG: OsmC family protein [Alphaproteobacteria bacterium]|nr:OsmC family protein [Alphaproteobacteria bacterium]MCZ6589207.1 OsmC family protein [Alphaproteobacteria bacterium]MCZ6840683.1 OsmC family protein [Alphaproteobacteria bacterium]